MVISPSIWAASYTVAAAFAGDTFFLAEAGLSPAADGLGVAQLSSQSAEVLLARLNLLSKKPEGSNWSDIRELFDGSELPEGDASFAEGAEERSPLPVGWISAMFAPEHLTAFAPPPDVHVTFVSSPAGISTAVLPVLLVSSSEPAIAPALHSTLDMVLEDTLETSDGFCSAEPGVSHGFATPEPAADSTGTYQVWVGKHPVIQLPNELRAAWVAQRLRYQLEEFPVEAIAVQLRQQDGIPMIYLNGQLLLMVNEDLASHYDRTPDLLAIDWANNLRLALGQPSLTLADAQTELYGLSYTGEVLDGSASWYGPYFHGRLTATGETFNQTDLTAAHPSLPFGTYLEVINQETGQSVVVRVNDRGPYVGDRSLDLSWQAAQCLGSEEAGVVEYEAHVMAMLPQEPLAISTDTLLALERQRSRQEPS